MYDQYINIQLMKGGVGLAKNTIVCDGGLQVPSLQPEVEVGRGYIDSNWLVPQQTGIRRDYDLHIHTSSASDSSRSETHLITFPPHWRLLPIEATLEISP